MKHSFHKSNPPYYHLLHVFKTNKIHVILQYYGNTTDLIQGKAFSGLRIGINFTQLR